MLAASCAHFFLAIRDTMCVNLGIGYDQGADKCNNPASLQESTVARRLVAAGGGHLLQRLE